MSASLDSLQQQFAANTAEITSNLLKLRKTLDANDRTPIVDGINRCLSEAKQCLKQMETSITSMPFDERKTRQLHLLGFENELKRLENDFQRGLKFDTNEFTVDLLDEEEGDSKTTLLPSSDTSRKTARLKSDEIGAQILNNLSERNETIARSCERLRRSNYDLGRSSKIANMILRKAMHNKLTLYTIALVGLLTVVVIAYRNMFIM
ncbi:V-SNARE-like protein [Dinothrombium tinctorium]|uniref:V-SNARE-like protein n=1 Tax=Dinothrombium tinctorium TaxID=1965070 RepID=A0A3S3RYA6_9ACAR|nr:V-SNARE-like protein [Dinothrombium tinctorium]RWS02120.1 V-SNARE-like protein [Dinothrombium tinctorium]RWS06522.1 V-SNARE-like protein [Dinothrombium tinctorium]